MRIPNRENTSSDKMPPTPESAQGATDHQGGDPHYEYSGVQQAEPVLAGEICETPVDQHSHSSALNPEAERYENGCGDRLANKVHCGGLTSSEATSTGNRQDVTFGHVE